MNKTTACPLDCYDACSIIYDDSKLKAFRGGHTQGFLCPHMNHYDNFKTIKSPSYKGKEISYEKVFELLEEIVKSSKKNEILHYRGSGNFGLMQEVTDHFFASYGATLTDGSLCDGVGEAGILQGRGSNKNMPLSEIEKSEVVILWGRNPHTTSSHLLPLLKNKKLIVIDPVKTKIAQKADVFVQIKPNKDLDLAMFIFNSLYKNGYCDVEFVKKYAYEIEKYYKLTEMTTTVSKREEIGCSLSQVDEIIELIKDKKVAIVCGLGIQKYSNGADVMRAIDSIAVGLGLFAKEGSGLAYLGDSKAGIVSPFHSEAKRVSKVNTPFENFKTVFIQGANPLSQMPNSLRVKESLSQVKNLIYFGLYENETSQVADLVIPTKIFLYKSDIRTSYSHNLMLEMSQVARSEKGISEYDLSRKLCKLFDIEIKSEKEYLKHFRNFTIQGKDGLSYVEGREERPYKKGFDTVDKQFRFLQTVDIKRSESDTLYLITPKSPTSLNSQFRRSENVYINSTHGYKDEEIIQISSINGSIDLEVKIDNRVREDCVLIYSGTKGVNSLTSSEHANGTKSAIFQEYRVQVSSCIMGV